MRLTQYKTTLTNALLASVLLFSFNAQAELVTNGSLTGSVANVATSAITISGGALPSDWTLVTAPNGTVYNTPDTVDITHNVGQDLNASNGFRTTASDSPDGGTWIGVGRDGANAQNEIFGQLVSGFTIGQDYTLSWYDANFGIGFSNLYDDTNRFTASLGGLSFTGDNRVLGTGWEQQSFLFTATQDNYALSFGLATPGVSSYLSIDGISIEAVAAVTPVPEPQTWAMLAGGLLLLRLQTRKRQA